MQVIDFHIQGLKLIKLKRFGDARGFFVEHFKLEKFQEAGIANNFVQDNYSRSQKNVLRGLHYQWDKPQAKLVTCTRGKIWDVAVDIRANSPTFGQYVAAGLNGDEPSWFYIPAGFAHGFAVLSDEGADLLYKVDAYYNPRGEGALAWNDPDLKIPWPVFEPILSAKDNLAQSFQDYKQRPVF